MAQRVPELCMYLSYRLGRRPYADYYGAVMRRKARGAVRRRGGGRRPDVGRGRVELVRSLGLRPHDSLLDFGCGPLRAGIHFVEFLEPGHYWGVDVCADLLEMGREFLAERALEWKRPTLRVVADLSFEWVDGRTFDFVVAQKVLNHMPLEDVDRFLRNARRAMSHTSVLVASFVDGAVADPRGARFHYAPDTLAALARRHGYHTEVVLNQVGFAKTDRSANARMSKQRYLKLSLAPTANASLPVGDA